MLADIGVADRNEPSRVCAVSRFLLVTFAWVLLLASELRRQPLLGEDGWLRLGGGGHRPLATVSFMLAPAPNGAISNKKQHP